IPRLIDIGIEPYLATSSLLGVLAQRLLRRSDPTSPDGFKGRLAVYELLDVTDRIRTLTNQRADAVQLREAAIAEGFEPMRVDAEVKVANGLSTMDEVYRVLH
ncbi:MAG: type II secretion system protein GspE, partial [Planctomycetota bacterium]